MEIGTINSFRSLTSVPSMGTPKSLYKSNLRKNVFGLKPGGLLTLFTSTSNRETQSHKKKYDLTWPLLASFRPQTSKEKRSSQQTTSTVCERSFINVSPAIIDKKK